MEDNQKILENLNPNQKEAVKTQSGETLVIAGAGSGKTAVLTRRCAYLIKCGENAGSILCLTFTNKAAAEMNERLEKLLQEVDIFLPKTKSWDFNYEVRPLLCTFHSLGVKLLREFGEKLGLQKTYSILDSEDGQKIIKNILKDKNLDPKQYSPKLISHFISQCKQELLMSKDSYKLKSEYPPIIHKIYHDYEQHLKANNAVDFDDLIMLPYFLLKENGDVRKILQNRWKHIMVDEFQDTNSAQFEFIKLLYEEI